uniref:hypothetical protein n=1 Tax=Polynucleobacter sp. TaxID=2029855 RepID=UPI0040471047
MPLQSVINGAKQCQVLTKRTRLRCKNPAAYGCLACRMHGAHKSRNVLRGENHPQYRSGERTKESEEKQRKSSIILLTLRDIGDHINLFNGGYTRGRKPKGYVKYYMDDPEQLALAILATLREPGNT